MNEETLFSNIQKARAREEKDDHLTELERQTLVRDFESFYFANGWSLRGYPINGTLTNKYIFIVYQF